MSKPSRHSVLHNVAGVPRTFFATTRTAEGKSSFQSERMAHLSIDVLRSAMKSREIIIHEFVIMSNHVHVLMTVPGEVTIEKAMQLIKGRFSFRANRELGFTGEVWQRGFSDVRIVDEQSFNQHHEYIDNNPGQGRLGGPSRRISIWNCAFEEAEARRG